MEIPKLEIGNITADIPIVQGGMGVRVSLSSLASAVANEGGLAPLPASAWGTWRLQSMNLKSSHGKP